MGDAASERRIPGFILLLFAVDCGLVLAYAADWALGARSWKVGAILDPKGSANLTAWWTSVQLFLLAYLLGSFARDKFDRRNKASWLLLLLPVVFSGLSFEQIGELHKWYILRSGGLLSRGVVHELLSAGAVLALVALAGYCVGPYIRGRRSIGAKYVLSLVVLGVSGVGLRAAAASLPPVPKIRLLAACGEGLGELVGVTLLLWATHELLVSHRVSPTGIAIRHLQGDPPA